MPVVDFNSKTTLTQMIETKIHELTHGRVRNLSVQEVQGQVVVNGQVKTRHTKQLALQGALELLSGDRFRDCITVI